MARFETRDGCLSAFGELNAADFAAFERCCRDCLATTSGDFVVDFSGVDYMTSAYLGALLELMQGATDRGRHMKVRASPPVNRLLQLTGLGDALDIVT